MHVDIHQPLGDQLAFGVDYLVKVTGKFGANRFNHTIFNPNRCGGSFIVVSVDSAVL